MTERRQHRVPNYTLKSECRLDVSVTIDNLSTSKRRCIAQTEAMFLEERLNRDIRYCPAVSGVMKCSYEFAFQHRKTGYVFDPLLCQG